MSGVGPDGKYGLDNGGYHASGAESRIDDILIIEGLALEQDHYTHAR
jgi:hypothetical protein